MSLKREVRDLILQQSWEPLAELAASRRRALGSLITLTYDADPLVSWRAVDGLGRAAAHVAGSAPDAVLEYLRRLKWLINDESGGVCWRAPEAMAEIVRRRPELFGDYIPLVMLLIHNIEGEDLRYFHAGALYAAGRLAAVGASHVGAVVPAIVSALLDDEPQVRGMAVWSLLQMRRGEQLAGCPELWLDQGPVQLYRDGAITCVSVSDLVRAAEGGDLAARSV